MNAAVVGDPVSGGKPGAQGGGAARELNLKLLFSKNLQHVANRIHATQNVDEIILEVSADICRVFNSDRLTIYVVSEDGQSIVSKVKTGLNSFRDLKLSISPTSIAGYVAQARRVVNVADVYVEEQLKVYHPDLHFLQEVDKRTGYRTKQMLVAPILEEPKIEGATPDLIGVVQIINNKSGQPFGDVEVDGIEELCKTLAIAMRNRKKEEDLETKAKSMGPQLRTKYDSLVSDAVLSGEEFRLAANSARRKAVDIETVLLQEFQVKREAIGHALAKFFGVAYEPFKIDRLKPLDLLKSIKRDYVESAEWMPVEDGPSGIVVLALDPERIRSSRVVNNIFARTGKIEYRVTTRDEFRQTMDQLFGEDFASGSINSLLSDLEDGDTEYAEVAGDEASAASDNELVKFVNKIILDAYQQGASDIHIEPYPGKGKTEIRFRKDGTLSPYIEVPASYRAPLVARLKIMCDLDISEKRKPQDGKIKFKRFGPLDIELRVATIPSAGGVEDVVMRILAAGEPIPVDKLALSPHNLERLKNVVSKPYGLFFVCGPTGSGKTTTLHSVLSFLNTPETKIWTAEDPVEITQKGLRQVQVNRKAGLDFATVMKSFLRADPDIIMVGEMRDKETVATGIEASLTGHLVFATLHTNSAPESIVRLLDMGMDPFNFADALLGILAQRLAKKLCVCKEAYTPNQAEIKAFLTEYADELKNTEEWRKDPQGEAKKLYETWLTDFGVNGKLTMHRAKGCEKCNGSGYKGRMGLHELLIGTDPIKKQIQEHARVADMFTTAIGEGMRTLKMDGMEKVLSGHLDMKQVRAVCIK
jgi:type II secretory ATPase GspE/PulE/Tfp pilus assembly ATPase PilB-like protein